jgi:hypothetical protein
VAATDSGNRLHARLSTPQQCDRPLNSDYYRPSSQATHADIN